MNPCERPLPPTESAPRRKFIQQSLALTLGGVSVSVPLGAGFAFWMDPVCDPQPASGSAVRVTGLADLPDDGAPRKFPVRPIISNAWARVAAPSVGAVFLRRTPAGGVQALNAACPHAGCPVDYEPGRKGFLCPCHQSVFTLEGALADPNSHALRALDALRVEVREGTEVWVHFQNFLPGHAEQYPAV